MVHPLDHDVVLSASQDGTLKATNSLIVQQVSQSQPAKKDSRMNLITDENEVEVLPAPYPLQILSEPQQSGFMSAMDCLYSGSEMVDASPVLLACSSIGGIWRERLNIT